jgi:glucosamine 6-phosphate synthetase-like amidotransferase/phosphosugar isomerase protein
MKLYNFDVAFFYDGKDNRMRTLLLAQHRMSIEARDAAVAMTAAGSSSSSCLIAQYFFHKTGKDLMVSFYDCCCDDFSYGQELSMHHRD